MHYYEDGNVQKVSKKDMECSGLKFTDQLSLAEEVVRKLEEVTNRFVFNESRQNVFLSFPHLT